MTRPRKPTPAAEQTALFGNSAPLATTQAPATRPVVQDTDLVAAVVKTADDPGFLLIERSGRVVKADPAKPGVVDSAARHEQDSVLQLLDAGNLRTGGTHHVHHHGHEGPARAILVPKRTRDMVTRWSNLRPLPAQRDNGSRGRTPRPVSGRISVDVVEPGKALVLVRTSATTSIGGTICRERDPNRPFGKGGYYVENDDGQVIGTVSSFRAGAEKLARHHGYRPGPIEIEHEHRNTPPF